MSHRKTRIKSLLVLARLQTCSKASRYEYNQIICSMIKQTYAKAMLLLTGILMDLLAGTEFDLFVPSFPELQDHFHLTPVWVEALLSINFIWPC